MALVGYLKQSTAATLLVGPFVDETDGKTAETALTLSQADFKLSKNGGTMAQKNQASTAVHDALGYYTTSIDATDTNTLGRLTVAVHESGALPVRQDYCVVAANIYDSLVGGTDLFDVSVTQWIGTAAATPTVNGVPEVDMTYRNGQAVAENHAGAVAAGSTSSTCVLASGANSGNDYYNDSVLVVISSTGVVQAAFVSAYVGATRTCTITPNWGTTPDNTYKYVVIPQ